MAYLQKWRYISARTRGLLDVIAINSASNNRKPWSNIRSQCLSILAAIKEFIELHARSFQFESSHLLTQVINASEQLSKINSTIDDTLVQFVREAATSIILIDSEISYLLSDEQIEIRSRTVMAFIHLRRVLFVDKDLNNKWITAYHDGEIRCEALGAAHLLSHGLFPFKVNADGARTDLVFPEAVRISDASFSAGLILTEWKIADGQRQATIRFNEAMKQVSLYAGGILASAELRKFRYLIVVTPLPVEVQDDLEKDGVIYRHINISLENETPSKTAKRLGRSSNK